MAKTILNWESVPILHILLDDENDHFRTGYLICRYLIQMCGVDPREAVCKHLQTWCNQSNMFFLWSGQKIIWETSLNQNPIFYEVCEGKVNLTLRFIYFPLISPCQELLKYKRHFCVIVKEAFWRRRGSMRREDSRWREKPFFTIYSTGDQ